jgi:hypothetical protein
LTVYLPFNLTKSDIIVAWPGAVLVKIDRDSPPLENKVDSLLFEVLGSLFDCCCNRSFIGHPGRLTCADRPGSLIVVNLAPGVVAFSTSLSTWDDEMKALGRSLANVSYDPSL